MGERAEMEEAMTGVWELALVGSLPNAGGGRGQGVRREAAMVATPFASHSAMAFTFLLEARSNPRPFQTGSGPA